MGKRAGVVIGAGGYVVAQTDGLSVLLGVGMVEVVELQKERGISEQAGER